ncbi:MAG: purine-nucleoside phosphorylase [Clostridium lundense]|nr:purine-nucleoside phosphorylase [Clostridium lundense]
MNLEKVKESVDFIKSKIDISPEIGIILGSGLGDLAEKVENKVIVKYEDIPNMPKSTVVGHAGQYVFGKLSGKDVVMMQGRIHYYEGHPMEIIALPIHIMKFLGIKTLIVTNAAGGVNTSFNPGDLMIITDHINFVFNNPLIGKNDEEIGPRFPDMSMPYDKDLVNLSEEVAKTHNINIQKGVYVMMPGPTYETPAEVKMIRIIGGDAVGMSTVPEVIVAKHAGLKVLGISCITNMASGILDQPLNHQEVIETSNRVKGTFTRLITNIVEKM